jgi:hypothetical protein
VFILYLHGKHDFTFFEKYPLTPGYLLETNQQREENKGGAIQVNSSIKYLLTPAYSVPFLDPCTD